MKKFRGHSIGIPKRILRSNYIRDRKRALAYKIARIEKKLDKGGIITTDTGKAFKNVLINYFFKFLLIPIFLFSLPK